MISYQSLLLSTIMTSQITTCHVASSVESETHFVCEAHMHAQHANARGVWGHAPQKILKIAPSEIESESILNDLSTMCGHGLYSTHVIH